MNFLCQGFRKLSSDREKGGGFSLKRIFMVGLTRLLGGGLTQACADSAEFAKYRKVDKFVISF